MTRARGGAGWTLRHRAYLSGLLVTLLLLVACAGSEGRPSVITQSTPTPELPRESRSTSHRLPFAPSRLALDSQRALLLILSKDGRDLAVLDAKTLDALGEVHLSASEGVRSAGGVAVDERSGRAFVAQPDADRVTVVDVPLRASISTLRAGRSPIALAFDSTRQILYVANLGFQSARVAEAIPGSVSVLDVGSGTMTRTIELDGHPSVLALDVERQRLYLAGPSREGPCAFFSVETSDSPPRTTTTRLTDCVAAISLERAGGIPYLLQALAAAGQPITRARVATFDQSTYLLRPLAEIDGAPVDLAVTTIAHDVRINVLVARSNHARLVTLDAQGKQVSDVPAGSVVAGSIGALIAARDTARVFAASSGSNEVLAFDQ